MRKLCSLLIVKIGRRDRFSVIAERIQLIPDQKDCLPFIVHMLLLFSASGYRYVAHEVKMPFELSRIIETVKPTYDQRAAESSPPHAAVVTGRITTLRDSHSARPLVSGTL